VRPCPIVLSQPIIQIGLQFVQVVIELFAKCGGVKLFLDGAMEAFADTVGLRVASLGAAVVDVLHRQVQFVLVVLALAAIFRATIGEHAQQRNFVLLEERQHTVVEQISRDQGGLAVVPFGEADLGVSIEKGLLIDAPYALDGADIVRVLGAEIAGMRGLDFAVGLLRSSRD